MNALMQKQYIKLTRFLGETLGPEYEIALYDLDTDTPCVIALANIGVSGRQLGSPLSGILERFIETKEYMTMDSKVNYTGIGAGEKMLRCSALFLKDDDGEPFGLISIAFDDSRYRQLSDQLLKLRHPDAFVESHFVYDDENIRRASAKEEEGVTEVFTSSIDAILSKIVQQAASGIDAPLNRLSGPERTEFIGRLKEAGAFNIKHAIPGIAKIMECSPATVYRHLSNANVE
jgi:predicted transcriptional regulator YheO